MIAEVADRLSRAAEPIAIGEEVARACGIAVPFAMFSYVVFTPGVQDRPLAVLRSTEHAPAWLAARFGPMLQAVARDVPGGLAAALCTPGAFLLYERYPISTLQHTELWVDHWRPVGCAQQLSAPLWRGGAPVGYVNITRTSRDPPFTPGDVRTFDALRVQAERALLGVSALGQAGLATTLEALAHSYPYPAFLLDEDGRLEWLSDGAVARLGVGAARLGGACLVRGNAALESLRRCARALAGNPAFAAERALRRDGTLRRGERLALRRFPEAGRTRTLLALVPALARIPGEHPSPAARGGLGAVEAEVARLAAEGFSVLNVASRLGITEATVRTHLRRVYAKLGVHGRAELARALYHGAA